MCIVGIRSAITIVRDPLSFFLLVSTCTVLLPSYHPLPFLPQLLKLVILSLLVGTVYFKLDSKHHSENTLFNVITDRSAHGSLLRVKFDSSSPSLPQNGSLLLCVTHSGVHQSVWCGPVHKTKGSLCVRITKTTMSSYPIVALPNCSHENASGYYRVSVFFFVQVFTDLIPKRVIPVCIFSLIAYFMVGESLSGQISGCLHIWCLVHKVM